MASEERSTLAESDVDLIRGTQSGRDGPFDRPGKRDVRGLPGEEERVFDGSREDPGSADAADAHVAVGSARERILVPVVEPELLDERAQPARGDRELLTETAQRDREDLDRCPAGDPCRGTAAAPGDRQRP